MKAKKEVRSQKTESEWLKVAKAPLTRRGILRQSRPTDPRNDLCAAPGKERLLAQGAVPITCQEVFPKAFSTEN
jgi:hypothetical protein